MKGIVPAGSPLAKHWMLEPGVTFLNHGSFGACPREVLEHQQRLRARLEAQPVRFLARDYFDLLDEARAEMAEFFRCCPEDLIFVTNATSAVNAVVQSLAFEPGDEILTTNHDYNACHNALLEVERRTGAKVVVASGPFPIASPDEVAQPLLAAITPRTRLVVLDHITSPTALVFPIERLIAEIESRGIPVLVDGAHVPGQLPLALGQLRPSFYTGNLHKWLCAPKGCAFLFAREDRQENLRPAVTSHGENRRRANRSAFHDRFDWCGTHDPTAWLCAGESIRWCDGLLEGGIGELRARNHALVLEGRRIIADALEIPALPCPEEMLGSMATLPLRNDSRWQWKDERIDPQQTWLWNEYRIEVPVTRWNDARWLRISAQAYNSIEQYRYLADALRESEKTDGRNLTG